MTPDLRSLIRNPAIGLHEIAEQTGLPLAYVAGWHDGYFSHYDAQEMLPYPPTRDAARDYERGRADGGNAWYAEFCQPTEAA